MIGANVSAAGGLINVFNQVEAWSLESCQFYVKPSRSWKGEMVREEVAVAFKERRRGSTIKSILGHSALIHNLAGEEEIRRKSVAGIRLELEIATALGIEQLVVHSGYGSLDMLKKGLNEVFSKYSGSARLLLEVSSGQKDSRGANIEELVKIMQEFKEAKLGVCLDTCHLFAAGYDIRDQRVFTEIINATKEYLGAIHLNDCKGRLGSHLYRHDHIGKGMIGKKTFRTLIRSMTELHIPKVLEIPKPAEMMAQNLKVIRSFLV